MCCTSLLSPLYVNAPENNDELADCSESAVYIVLQWNQTHTSTDRDDSPLPGGLGMPVMCTYAYTDRPEAEGRFLSISAASRVRVGGVGYTVSDYQYLRYIGPENENENSKTKANGNGNGSGGTRVWPRRPSRGAPENPRRCIASTLHVRVVRRGPMQEARPHLPPLIHPCRVFHI